MTRFRGTAVGEKRYKYAEDTQRELEATWSLLLALFESDADLDAVYILVLRWDELRYQYHALETEINECHYKLNRQDQVLFDTLAKQIKVIERKIPHQFLAEANPITTKLRRDIYENARETARMSVRLRKSRSLSPVPSASSTSLSSVPLSAGTISSGPELPPPSIPTEPAPQLSSMSHTSITSASLAALVVTASISSEAANSGTRRAKTVEGLADKAISPAATKSPTNSSPQAVAKLVVENTVNAIAETANRDANKSTAKPVIKVVVPPALKPSGKDVAQTSATSVAKPAEKVTVQPTTKPASNRTAQLADKSAIEPVVQPPVSKSTAESSARPSDPRTTQPNAQLNVASEAKSSPQAPQLLRFEYNDTANPLRPRSSSPEYYGRSLTSQTGDIPTNPNSNEHRTVAASTRASDFHEAVADRYAASKMPVIHNQQQTLQTVPWVRSPAPYLPQWMGLTHWGTEMVDVLFHAYVNGHSAHQRQKIAQANFARYGVKVNEFVFPTFLWRHYGLIPYYGFKGESYREALDRVYAEIPYEPECERARINDAVRICRQRYLKTVSEMDVGVLYRDFLLRLYGSPAEPKSNLDHAKKLIEKYHIVDGSVLRPPRSRKLPHFKRNWAESFEEEWVLDVDNGLNTGEPAFKRPCTSVASTRSNPPPPLSEEAISNTSMDIDVCEQPPAEPLQQVIETQSREEPQQQVIETQSQEEPQQQVREEQSLEDTTQRQLVEESKELTTDSIDDVVEMNRVVVESTQSTAKKALVGLIVEHASVSSDEEDSQVMSAPPPPAQVAPSSSFPYPHVASTPRVEVEATQSSLLDLQLSPNKMPQAAPQSVHSPSVSHDNETTTTNLILSQAAATDPHASAILRAKARKPANLSRLELLNIEREVLIKAKMGDFDGSHALYRVDSFIHNRFSKELLFDQIKEIAQSCGITIDDKPKTIVILDSTSSENTPDSLMIVVKTEDEDAFPDAAIEKSSDLFVAQATQDSPPNSQSTQLAIVDPAQAPVHVSTSQADDIHNLPSIDDPAFVELLQQANAVIPSIADNRAGQIANFIRTQLGWNFPDPIISDILDNLDDNDDDDDVIEIGDAKLVTWDDSKLSLQNESMAVAPYDSMAVAREYTFHDSLNEFAEANEELLDSMCQNIPDDVYWRPNMDRVLICVTEWHALLVDLLPLLTSHIDLIRQCTGALLENGLITYYNTVEQRLQQLIDYQALTPRAVDFIRRLYPDKKPEI